MKKADSAVRIFEVGLRDGLQNEASFVSIESRHKLLRDLIDAGVRALELGSFVSPKWVPAMASSEQLFELALAEQQSKMIPKDVVMSALVPNEKGLELALKVGVKEIAIFASCTESFSQKNTNCSVQESFERLKVVAGVARKMGLRIRGYLSTCFGCPFEGAVDLDSVIKNVSRMLDLGVYEISLGDTIGLASPGDVEKLLSSLLGKVSATLLAGHFHDTRGQAVANVLRAYQMGLRVFDTSIGGLGGCPYAPGATGNVATEDVVYLFNGMAVETGIDLSKLIAVNSWLATTMQKTLPSKVALAESQRTPPFGTCFL
jgi:hydroxymethylglutaryl-CoA lyase